MFGSCGILDLYAKINKIKVFIVQIFHTIEPYPAKLVICKEKTDNRNRTKSPTIALNYVVNLESITSKSLIITYVVGLNVRQNLRTF